MFGETEVSTTNVIHETIIKQDVILDWEREDGVLKWHVWPPVGRKTRGSRCCCLVVAACFFFFLFFAVVVGLSGGHCVMCRYVVICRRCGAVSLAAGGEKLFEKFSQRARSHSAKSFLMWIFCNYFLEKQCMCNARKLETTRGLWYPHMLWT